jgi:hypothetical protein
MTPEQAPGDRAEQLAAITRDLRAATAAWVAAGSPFDGPEDDAREAVFARLRTWNEAQR